MNQKSHNEHGVSASTFMTFASRHRWSVVRDFMSDMNGTKDYSIRIDEGADIPVGSCGLPPDMAMMAGEMPDPIDMEADKNDWPPNRRRIEHWARSLMLKCDRVSWLENQIHESSITGRAPMAEMTESEQARLISEVNRLRRQRGV